MERSPHIPDKDGQAKSSGGAALGSDMVPRRILARGVWNARVYRPIYKRQLRPHHAKEKPVKNQQHAEARPHVGTVFGQARSRLARVRTAPCLASLVPPRRTRSCPMASALAVCYFSQCIVGNTEGTKVGTVILI